jgi:cation:H+ antiporter
MLSPLVLPTIKILVGFVSLVLGGELLVRGAVGVANLFRVSPLVIGLTIVAFGTSAPELAVSLQAAYSGDADITIGNVVGSNIFNLLGILGISAMIAPLMISRELIRSDVPIMIVASVAVAVVAGDQTVSQIEGGFLFLGIVAYTLRLILKSRHDQGLDEGQASSVEIDNDLATSSGELPQAVREKPVWVTVIRCLSLIAVGLVLLSIGSKWLVAGATVIASHFGVSELTIGLTIVAIGTSLPEVATSVLATLRGHREIAVGNVVGSNIFNIFCVLGLSSLVTPGGVNVAHTALFFDIPIMIVVAIICWPVFYTGLRISRIEGWIFFDYYVVYMAYLITTQNDEPVPPWLVVLTGSLIAGSFAGGAWSLWAMAQTATKEPS